MSLHELKKRSGKLKASRLKVTEIVPVLNLGFVLQSLSKLHSTLMWRSVDWWTVTFVSNEPAACIFCVEDGSKTSHRTIARKEAISSLKTVILYYILPVQNKLHLPEFLNSSTESIPQRFININIISTFVCHRFSHSFAPCFSSCFLSVRHSCLCSRFLYNSFLLSFFAFTSSFLSIKVQKFN